MTLAASFPKQRGGVGASPMRLRAEMRSRSRAGFVFAIGVAVTSLFFTLPLARYTAFGVGTDLRIYDLTLLGLLPFVVGEVLEPNRRLLGQRFPYLRAQMALIALVWASLVLTGLLSGVETFAAAVIRALRFTGFLLAASAVLGVCDRPDRQRRLLAVFTLNVAAQMVLVAFQAAGLVPNLWPEFQRFRGSETMFVGTMSPHHLQISIVAIMGVALSATWMSIGRHTVTRLMAAGLVPLSLIALVSSGMRSAWVAFPVITGALVIRRRGGKFLLVLLVSAAVAVGSSAEGLLERLAFTVEVRVSEPLQLGGVEALVADRTPIYFEDLPRMFARNPWILALGCGFQNTLRFLGASGAHNNFLHVLIELGIGGFLVYCAFLVRVLRGLSRAARSPGASGEQVIAWDVGAVFVGVLITMLANETLWGQYSMFTLTGQIMVLVALGLCSQNWARVAVRPLGASHSALRRLAARV